MAGAAGGYALSKALESDEDKKVESTTAATTTVAGVTTTVGSTSTLATNETTTLSTNETTVATPIASEAPVEQKITSTNDQALPSSAFIAKVSVNLVLITFIYSYFL